MLERILRFAREEDFEIEICRRQLRALWTALCICEDWECDTLAYDNALREIWEAVISNRDIAGSSDEFDDFDCFDLYMNEDLC